MSQLHKGIKSRKTKTLLCSKAKDMFQISSKDIPYQADMMTLTFQQFKKNYFNELFDGTLYYYKTSDILERYGGIPQIWSGNI